LLKKHNTLNNEQITKIKPLKNQGLSNKIYLLCTSHSKYILRVFNPKLHVDRNLEYDMQLKASSCGIAAKPILYDKKKSLMIMEYLKGKHKKNLSFLEIKKFAILLHKLHNIYVKRDIVICHHDLNYKNILFSKNIKLLDWEYAYKDDRYFDLASFIIEFKLNKNEETIFLKAYFLNKKMINKIKLNLFKIKYKKVCKQWHKTLESISK